MSSDYPNTCNDCKHSSPCGMATYCNNKKRPKDRVKLIGYVENTRRQSIYVKPTWQGCKEWLQGEPSQQIFKSPFF